jgi:HEAT repeat protein
VVDQNRSEEEDESMTDFNSAEEALAALRDDERPEAERILAAQALSTLGTIKCIGPMFETLERSESGLGLEIAAALRALQAGALLTRDLKTGNERRREIAALGLLRLNDPGTVPALLGAQGDSEERIRVRVFEALARIATTEALDALEAALSDDNADVRCTAADAMARHRRAGASEAIERQLEVETDSVARSYLERALKRLGAA